MAGCFGGIRAQAVRALIIVQGSFTLISPNHKLAAELSLMSRGVGDHACGEQSRTSRGEPRGGGTAKDERTAADFKILKKP